MVDNNVRLIFIIQNSIYAHINHELPASPIEYIELVFMMIQNLNDHSLKTYHINYIYIFIQT